MSNKENIKNKFKNFEPEVDDNIIDEKWEKIKYFVPQKENKKRGAFFFLYGVLAILTLGLGTVTLWYYTATNKILDESVNAEQITSNHKIALSLSPKSNGSKTHSQDLLKKDVSTKNVLKQNNFTSENEFQKAEDLNNIIKEKKSNKLVLDEKNSIASNPTFNVLSSSNSDSVINPEKKTEQDAIVFQKLDLLPTALVITENTNDISPTIENYFIPTHESLFSIDIFGGAQQSYTDIKTQGVNQKNNSINVLFGFDINYHITNKINVTGQFTFSEKNLDYHYTTSENKIVDQTNNISVGPLNNLPDTTFYKKANTTNIIQSKNNYHIGLGIEYTLLQKNKFTMGTFMLFNLRSTKYNYGYINEYGQEIITYIDGSPNSPSSNLAPADFMEGNYIQAKNILSFGIMPGAVIGYKVNGKTTIIFKPAYFIDFAEKKLIINSGDFKLKQNNLLLSFGLRLSL